MKKFLIALQFLTILPLKVEQEIEEKDYGKSLIFFPVVGALMGLVLAVSLSVFGFLPHLVTAALVLVFSIIITGGIHLDGFADTCDGFYGSRSKEDILRIMRDSYVGTMAAVGVFSLLLLKFALLASIPKEILWKSLIMMVTFARWSQVLACYTSHYARKEGKAKHFVEYASNKELLTGALFTLALFLVLMKIKGLILFAICTLLVVLFTNYVRRKIGGMTGDTLGATSEIAEVMVLLFSVMC